MNASAAYTTACRAPQQQNIKHVIPVHEAAAQAYQNDQQLAQRVPVRARGDLKWPPAPYRKQPGDDLPAPRTETPRLPKKDYTQFFAQNRLPETHCGYRVAPGVCHITPEEGRYLPNDTTSF
ncbi:uncharacterized protein LOC122364628 [Amphibalanus amphitrite]|uniref:uncharacterized protein LOC122364628 n=1 Tax=Amphibalanus amphitrite TaxID=1232801 RepID=UPI001C921EA4|nr:uncharacterized protein LOC122364628 [Amphibalanus amphitrite]